MVMWAFQALLAMPPLNGTNCKHSTNLLNNTKRFRSIFPDYFDFLVVQDLHCFVCCRFFVSLSETVKVNEQIKLQF